MSEGGGAVHDVELIITRHRFSRACTLVFAPIIHCRVEISRHSRLIFLSLWTTQFVPY